MTASQRFQDLLVWQKAHACVLAIYEFTGGFPRCETYGLAAQMRRASVSIAANIAEGFKKLGRGDKLRFMNIAQGSLAETRYYLILSQDLGYGNTAPLMATLEETSRLLTAYAKAILART